MCGTKHAVLKHGSVLLLMLRSLRDALNRSLLRMSLGDIESWWTVVPVCELDTQRLCDEIGSSVFVTSLWVGDPERALFDHMGRLNTIKVIIDGYVDVVTSGGCLCKVSDEAQKAWLCAGRSFRVMDVGDALRNSLEHLDRILFLTDPRKLQSALMHSGKHIHADLCRLYSEDLDTAVELVSKQINLVHAKTFSLLA
jgi:hypothetical protein